MSSRLHQSTSDFWDAMNPGSGGHQRQPGVCSQPDDAGAIVVDVNAETVIKTSNVDPGPRTLALNTATNQLLVMAQGTGTLDLVGLTSYAISARINAGDTERQGNWKLPPSGRLPRKLPPSEPLLL